jgi:diaminopimelate epimerase
MPLQFIKMHGLGNDFVIFDGRKNPIQFSKETLVKIAARRTGIGCDQVIIMEPSQKADVFMRIYNPDGGEINSCGNATRCVAWVMMEETGKHTISIETNADILKCDRIKDNLIRADMGQPRFEWNQIPLSEPRDTLHLAISLGELNDPVAVSMGNPHAIFVVADVDKIRVPKIGPTLEHYPLFPDRANISFAQPLSDTQVKLRVWERGAGETLACGTAACATLVGLHRRGLVSNKADILLPGGTLAVEWDKASNHVFMTGPVVLSFSGLLHD